MKFVHRFGVLCLISTTAFQPLSYIQAQPPVAVRRPAPAAPRISETVLRSREKVDEFIAQGREVFIENAGALVPFFERLFRYQNNQDSSVHILHYGDSHTAADEWTGHLRMQFQERFGDGGSGFSLAGRPWTSYRRMDVKSWSSPGWYTDGLIGRYGNGYYGLGGVSVTAQRPRERVFLEANCERVELFFLKQPGGGSLSLSHNGSVVDRISTDGVLGPGYFSYKVTPGVNRFELATMDNAPVRLFGWVAEMGRGITYESMGINGAQASIAFNWNEQLLSDQVAKRNPALIVLAYGTNEADNREWTRESYRDMFATLIYRFRKAAPAATILVVGPPDRMVRYGRTWNAYGKIDPIIDAQREAALGTGCAFVDLRAKMGGKGSIEQWVMAGLAQYDRVHFTAPGYRLLGDVIFDEITQHYGTFAKVREKLFSLSPSGQLNGQKIENH